MPSTRNGTSQDTPSKETKGDGDDESSASEEDSCSYDEGETEKRKYRCLDDMLQLEKQFSDMRELLYKERMQDIDQKMNLLTEDSAPEYTNPVKDLSDSIDHRLQAAETLFECKTTNIESKFEQELKTCELDYIDACRLVKMRMVSEVEDKIQKLEEEEALAKITFETSSRKRKLRSEFLMIEKKKKPVSVTGPYVVYMLRDIDIMEDINDIRKGLAMSQVKMKCSMAAS